MYKSVYENPHTIIIENSFSIDYFDFRLDTKDNSVGQHF